MTIARITAAVVRTYHDTGQVRASIDWIDTRGHTGSTQGSPDNAHMAALLARAERERIIVRIER